MITSQGSIVPRTIQLLALTLHLTLLAAGHADEADPTALSPQISQLLSDASLVPTATEEDVPPAPALLELPKLRIKAIVLRDQDHGTALIAVGEDETLMIPLRRTASTSSGYQLRLRGMLFRVEQFSGSSIHLRNLSNQELVIVH